MSDIKDKWLPLLETLSVRDYVSLTKAILSGSDKPILAAKSQCIADALYEDIKRREKESQRKRKVGGISAECPRNVHGSSESEKEKDVPPLSPSPLSPEPPITTPPISPSEKERASPNAGTRARFVPPTVEEVAAYCRERGNSVDAEMFCDFYSSKGWLVGKNSMKDWKSAVRTWEKRAVARNDTGDFLDFLNAELEREYGT